MLWWLSTCGKSYDRYDETCAHEDMLFHKGRVCDTHEIQGISGISIDFSYIGQCDLINTCFGLP